MDVEAVYLSIETGRIIAVGMENDGENNNGVYHVELYHNAISFVWGDPCNEGDIWDSDTEKDVKAWGLPFLKDDDSNWLITTGPELALLHTLGNNAEFYTRTLGRKVCGDIFESVGKGIKS